VVDRDAIGAWLEVLDDLTYYVLLGTRSDATADDLKSAFHAFAQTFHPDAHIGRPEDERDALGRIFRRGTEAYRVLSDPTLREGYDASLAAGAAPADASRKSSMPPSKERPAGPKRLEDTIRAPNARTFARRAEELAKAGDYKQAKIQLTMARHYEPNNAALEAFLKEIDAKGRGPGATR
jgi:DnaJ-class molecular chaperone